MTVFRFRFEIINLKRFLVLELYYVLYYEIRCRHKTKDQNSLVFSNVYIYKLSFRNCFSEHLAF